MYILREPLINHKEFITINMKRIRPFIGTELIKAMIGIHCCGKSVMLELIERELTEFGVSPTQFVSINFEDMNLIP